jgi:hypothetical protein
MFDEDPAHHVLVQFDAECVADLLSNPQIAEIRIAAFHLEDCGDQFSRWALWAGISPGLGGRKQSPVLTLYQSPVEPETAWPV